MLPQCRSSAQRSSSWARIHFSRCFGSRRRRWRACCQNSQRCWCRCSLATSARSTDRGRMCRWTQRWPTVFGPERVDDARRRHIPRRPQLCSECLRARRNRDDCAAGGRAVKFIGDEVMFRAPDRRRLLHYRISRRDRDAWAPSACRTCSRHPIGNLHEFLHRSRESCGPSLTFNGSTPRDRGNAVTSAPTISVGEAMTGAW